MTFKQKSEFWRTCTCHSGFDSFLRKRLLEELGGNSECDFFFFWILYNEICQHLEELHNLVNQYIPDDQMQNVTKQVKRSIQRVDKEQWVNVTEYENFTDLSDSTLHCKILPLVEF